MQTDGGKGKETDQLELAALLGWIRTFPLHASATTAADLYDGCTMAEVLVQIEPATFTPSWFAVLLRSDGSNSETLNTILNLLLHYYRHSLSDVCVAGELPIPAIPSTTNLSLHSLTSFLKLILGVAVSCPNKLLFISKIQSLDETTQHTLTACVASFIATVQELCSQPDSGPAQARDEVWQQKCHELDFQVALLKDERTSLVSENEELSGRVRAAAGLTRRDSARARQLETELAGLREELQRLRQAGEETRAGLERAVAGRAKEDRVGESELGRIEEELVGLRGQVEELRGGLGRGSGRLDGEAVRGRLEAQQDQIGELQGALEHQVCAQARLTTELEEVKDQVDVLREQGQRCCAYQEQLGQLRTRLRELETNRVDIMGEILTQENTASTWSSFHLIPSKFTKLMNTWTANN